MRAPRIILVALVLAVGGTAALAGRKADERLLQRLQRVDGTGSGLDADTVRGLSPDDMKTDDAELRRRIEALEALVGGGTPAPPSLRERLYARASRQAQVNGPERYVRTQCNDNDDVALWCAGGPVDGSIPITWIGVIHGDGTTTPDRCTVVTRGADGTPEIEAVIRCLSVP
jgi:hypothetical protein